jgi:hypothetical protein
MTRVPSFDIICTKCNGFGIAIDDPINAPDDAIIKCRSCNVPRGTMGSLRQIARSDRHTLTDL